MPHDAGSVDPSLIDTLSALGLTVQESSSFLSGDQVVYNLRTESRSGVAIIQIGNQRLSQGIVSIHDEGNGVRTLSRFRGLSLRITHHLSLDEVELYGAEVINARLDRLLSNKGFSQQTVPCPTALGNFEMTIRLRRYRVKNDPTQGKVR